MQAKSIAAGNLSRACAARSDTKAASGGKSSIVVASTCCLGRWIGLWRKENTQNVLYHN